MSSQTVVILVPAAPSGVNMAGRHRLRTCPHPHLRKSVIFNYIECAPVEPCAKCMNCKRRAPTARLVVQNSKSKACIYMPISLQKQCTNLNSAPSARQTSRPKVGLT